MNDRLAAVVAGGRLFDAGDPRPVPWWSFGKTVLAAAALALVQAGRLTLDELVAGEAFTLRQLLGHRTGLADYGMLRAYHDAVARGDAPWSAGEMLGRLPPPVDVPGARFSYSNVGYRRVVGLVEQAAGASLGDALARLVFEPLDVAGTRLATSADDVAATAWGNARGYDPGWVYHGLIVGPVGAAALLLDRLLRGDLLSPALLATMRTAMPVVSPPDSRPWATHGYGLGLMIGTGTPPMLFEGHTGGGPGSRIAVYRARDTGRTACVAASVEDEAAVERGAMALAAGGAIAARAAASAHSVAGTH